MFQEGFVYRGIRLVDPKPIETTALPDRFTVGDLRDWLRENQWIVPQKWCRGFARRLRGCFDKGDRPKLSNSEVYLLQLVAEESEDAATWLCIVIPFLDHPFEDGTLEIDIENDSFRWRPA